jgi:hypothetical protein
MTPVSKIKDVDPDKLYTSYFNDTTVKVRLAKLKELDMDEMTSSRGWFGYQLPGCSWSEQWRPCSDESNWRSWPAEAPGWIVKCHERASKWQNTCMLRKKAVYEMSEDDWQRLVKRIDYVKNDGYLVDDSDHSEVESEHQDEAWRETYRKAFQDALVAKFDGVFDTLPGNWGRNVALKFIEMVGDDDLTDRFWYDYMRDRWQGGEWDERSDGSMSIDTDEIVRGMSSQDVQNYLWPEDPRQMKFKFMAAAESLVNALLNDDTVTMIYSPVANRIVKTLLETEGPHDYSCVLINLPEELGEQIMAWGKVQVNDSDIYVDDEGGMGRETEPHVTVLYGLYDREPSDALMEVFERTAKFDIKLGPCSLFRNEGYDVLKISVTSPQLHALNQNVCAVAPYENKYPDYKPHITIAYVKPGTCDRLEGASPFDDPVKLGVTKLGQDGVFTAETVTFSSRDGHKMHYPLGMSASKAVKEAEEPEWDDGMSWQFNLCRMDTGSSPEDGEALGRWLRKIADEYHQETGRNMDFMLRASRDDFREWIENRLVVRNALGVNDPLQQEIGEAVDVDFDQMATAAGILDQPVDHSHGTMRRKAGKHIVDRVEIWNEKAPEDYRWKDVGGIRIVYWQSGQSGQPKKVWSSQWASYWVLKNALRNWRNLYGVPLFVDGVESGVVGYRNPALIE